MKCMGCLRWTDEIPERVIRYGGGMALCGSCLLRSAEYYVNVRWLKLVRPDEWEGGIL